MEKDHISDEVLMTLRRITRAIDLHSKNLVRNYGATGPQLLIMQTLSKNGELMIGEVTKHVNLSPATVTEIINRLEKRGFIEKKRSAKDKRQSIVRLTDLGTQMFDNAPPLLQERFIEQLEQLEDWEQTSLLSALQRVATMMEAKDIEASPILMTGPIEGSAEEDRV